MLITPCSHLDFLHVVLGNLCFPGFLFIHLKSPTHKRVVRILCSMPIKESLEMLK